MVHQKILKWLKPLPNPPKCTKEDKIKIAWAIACDGSITIHCYKHSSHYVLKPSVGFTNTEESIVKEVKKTVAMGNIVEHSAGNPKHKDATIWNLTSFLEILHLLKEIKNYLPIKKRRAELVIEFIESRIKRGVLENQHLPYSKREWEIYEEVKKLNKRGRITDD